MKIDAEEPGSDSEGIPREISANIAEK